MRGPSFSRTGGGPRRKIDSSHPPFLCSVCFPVHTRLFFLANFFTMRRICFEVIQGSLLLVRALTVPLLLCHRGWKSVSPNQHHHILVENVQRFLMCFCEEETWAPCCFPCHPSFRGAQSQPDPQKADREDRFWVD